MKKSFIFGSTLMALLVLSLMVRHGISYAADPVPERLAGGEYRVPLASEPGTLDPAHITGIYAVNVAVNLFDGLVDFDQKLNIVPALARRWIIARDHRAYTFFLRKGVRFHNGREIRAGDVIWSLTRLLDPATKSPAAPLFSYIRGADAFRRGETPTVAGLSAPDDHTVKIEMDNPFAPFLSILATANAKVVPREAVGPDFGLRPVGTGPFRFHAWQKGQEIVLTPNPDYFGAPPLIDRLRFRIYSNDQWGVIFDDFEKGLLEQAIIPKDRYDQIIADPAYTRRYRFSTTPGLNIVYIGMNGTLPPLDDRRVRQAFSLAIDTEAIVRTITGRGSVPAYGILPPGMAGFDPDFRGYGYDPDRARTLLAEAGYSGGKGIPPLEIWTVSKSERVSRELRAYQKYLGDVGVRLVPKIAGDWKEFVGLINQKKVPIFYAAWYADYPDPDNFLYVLSHSESPTNRMGYANPDVDAMLEEARHETDYMKRVRLYRKAEALIMADAPLICQHVNSSGCLSQPWVSGLEISYLGPAYAPLRKVRVDRKKQEKVLSR